METNLIASERIERSKIRSDGSAFSSKDIPKFFHVNNEKEGKVERCGSLSGSAEFSAFSGSSSTNSASISRSLFRNRSRSISVTDSTVGDNTDNNKDIHDNIDYNNNNKSKKNNNDNNDDNGHQRARTYPPSTNKGNGTNSSSSSSNNDNSTNGNNSNSNSFNMKSNMKSKSIKPDRQEKNDKSEKNINTAPITLSLAALQSNNALWNSRSRSAQSHEAVTLSLINPSLNISNLAVRKKFPPRSNVFQIDSEVYLYLFHTYLLFFYLICIFNLLY